MRRTGWVRGIALSTLLAAFALGPALVGAQDATPEGGGSPPAMEFPPPPAGAEVIATNLNNPRGLTFGPDGALYVAEAGSGGTGNCTTGPEGDTLCFGDTGSITRVENGSQERVLEGLNSLGVEGSGMNATGPHAVAFIGDQMYVVIGLGAAPDARDDLESGGPAQLGKIFSVTDGKLTEVADVAGFEGSDNPDGGDLDSNPLAMVALPDDSLAVTDAGGNFVAKVTTDGTISTLTVLADRMEPMPDGSADIPMQSVPDALAMGPDGSLYIGELTGFPFVSGGANVYRVHVDGGDAVLHADGFTNIIGVAFGPDGSLYVLELVKGGLLGIDPSKPETMAGQLTRIAPDGTRSVIASDGLVFPTGLAVGPDGAIYVANLGTMAGAGQVLRFAPEGGETTPEATPTA
ncbi:MAG: ScyD/ScyE family protein [Thermomicrobiales bacterium]|nr:ScyD/ScyE family protein [Thermomicrobiales bacterium]